MRLTLSSSKLLLAIIVAAVLVRVVAAVYLGDSAEPVSGAYDQVSYDALAQRLLAGHGFSFATSWYPFTQPDEPTSHWSFAYTLYLAGVYAVFGHHPLAARLIQVLFVGALTSLLVYRLGSRLFNATVGLLASLCAAFYAYLIFYNATLMSDSFYTVGVLLSLDLFLSLKEKPTRRTALLLGLTFGLTALLRQTILLLVPFYVLLFVWERRHCIPWSIVVIWLLSFTAILVPWTVRNQEVYGRFLLLNSNSGYALWASTHPSQGYDWQPDVETAVVPIPLAWRHLNEAELDALLSSDAVRNIMADPVRFFFLSLGKAREQFKFWPDARSSLTSNLSRTLSFGLALPFMLIGLVLSRRRWRELLPVYIFLVFHNAIFLLSWPAPRYRLISDALLLLFAAYTLADALSRLGLPERIVRARSLVAQKVEA